MNYFLVHVDDLVQVERYGSFDWISEPVLKWSSPFGEYSKVLFSWVI